MPIRNYLPLSLFLLLFSCAKERDYNPNSHLTPNQKAAIVSNLVRYLAKKPENVDDQQKFDAKYDSFYLQKSAAIRFERFYPTDDQFYFLITQPAPSLIEKRHATGGRFKLNDAGEMTEYEEIFRTWKMVPDTLKRRSYLLFDKMVKGEPLEPYYMANSRGIEYIEFPDERTYYDKTSRTWKLK